MSSYFLNNRILSQTKSFLRRTSLESSGLTILIIVIAIVIVIVLAVLLIHLVRKRSKNTKIPSDEENHEQSIKTSQNQINSKASSENFKEDVERIEKVYELQNKKFQCIKCKLPSAIFLLDCGCRLCVSCLGKFSDFNRASFIRNLNEDQCPNCNKKLVKMNQIGFECGICMVVKEEGFNLSCGCQFVCCRKCSNKMIEKKQCPNCRKDVKDEIFPMVPLNGSYFPMHQAEAARI